MEGERHGGSSSRGSHASSSRDPVCSRLGRLEKDCSTRQAFRSSRTGWDVKPEQSADKVKRSRPDSTSGTRRRRAEDPGTFEWGRKEVEADDKDKKNHHKPALKPTFEPSGLLAEDSGDPAATLEKNGVQLKVENKHRPLRLQECCAGAAEWQRHSAAEVPYGEKQLELLCELGTTSCCLCMCEGLMSR
ncbi:forkhead-associated domain-containing protein [Cyclospora cayetanensis]|uniref:Forkhead-associated domain-containing protein n=1 Tax=Cyclospora cayetanensis TaxID=88456 RepID=A0A1D3D1I6_9EIME|nr:forkhead-associated domain-containing protein [Cyclospora cayetanensis]